VAQISLSLLLLIFAGLFIRSFQSAQSIDPGFNPHNVLIASYDLFTGGYSESSGVEFDRQLMTKLEAMPGVQSVALSTRTPLGFGGGSTSVKPEGYVVPPNVSMETQVAIVTPNYLHTMQVPLVKGRDFTLQDTKSSQRVVIVSEAFANRYWPNQEPVGKQLNSDLTHEWFTVIGIARDSKVNNLNEKPTPFVYLPLYQVYRATLIIHARVNGDPLSYGKLIEKTVHELNADLIVFDITTLELRTQFASFGQRVAGTFVGAFGLLALVLAAVGIYGVTAYTAAAYARNRNPHDARCDPRARVAAGARARSRFDAHRCDGGPRAFVRFDALPEEFAAGCHQHRRGDFFERGDPALRRGLVRMPDPGLSRHACRSDGSAALRMKAELT
jgi:hypothetical protein